MGERGGERAGGAGADHHHGFAEQAAGLLHRMHADRQWLDQRAGFQRKTFGQVIKQFGRHVDEFGEGAVVHQPGEGQLFAEVVLAGLAEAALAAMLAGIGGDFVARRVALDAFTGGDDLAAELVAKDALTLDAGERVRRVHRNKHRACEVFVQVGTADAAPVHADLHPARLRRAGQRHLFQADVLTTVPDGGGHGGLAIHGCSSCCSG
jgi:hypothetical protein